MHQVHLQTNLIGFCTHHIYMNSAFYHQIPAIWKTDMRIPVLTNF